MKTLRKLITGGPTNQRPRATFLILYRKEPHYSHGHTRYSCCSLKKKDLHMESVSVLQLQYSKNFRRHEKPIMQ